MIDQAAPARSASSWLRHIIGLAVLGSIAAAPLAAHRFPGDTVQFALCSTVYIATLALCIHPRIPYSALCLAVFLWLGIWVKLATHHILDYPALFGVSYMEPVGNFSFAGGAWNDVVLTATLGGAGLMLAMLLGLRARMRSHDSDERSQPVVPAWYARYRAVAWTAGGVMLVAVVAANELLWMFKLGWRPRLALPWPFSGLLAWYFYIGAALYFAVLAGWDKAAGYRPWTGLAAAGIEGLASAASTMSRSLFLFHAGADVLALLREPPPRRKVGAWQLLMVVSAFIALFGVSVVWVTYSRYLGPTALPIKQQPPEHSSDQATAQARSAPPQDRSLSVVLHSPWFFALLIDRWPGLEGIMALSAHSGKSWDFFVRAAKERRTLDDVDLYTTISEPSYTRASTALYHYSANPGAIGLLYFSGSWWVVFFGMFGISLAAMALERAVDRVLGNPYATALVALYFAGIIIHLNPGFFQKLLTVFTTVAVCVLFAFLSRFPAHKPD